MDQFGSLFLNGRDDFGMAVSRRCNGDARRKVEKLIAVYIFYTKTEAALGDHGIRTRVAGRDEAIIVFDDTLRIWSGKRSV